MDNLAPLKELAARWHSLSDTHSIADECADELTAAIAQVEQAEPQVTDSCPVCDARAEG